MFDIDGTLLRCFGAGKKALVRACREVFGTVGSMEAVDFQGKTDPIILRESLGIMGYADDDIARNIEGLKRRYFTYLRHHMGDGTSVLLPGVTEILERLSEDNTVITGLLTGNFSESAAIKLGHFGLNRFFRFGVFGDDAPLRNDMPPIARERLLRDFGCDIPYRDIVIVGDTVHDIGCARSVGAVSVAVGTGWVAREVLLSLGPDHFFDDMSDVDRVIAAITA